MERNSQHIIQRQKVCHQAYRQESSGMYLIWKDFNVGFYKTFFSNLFLPIIIAPNVTFIFSSVDRTLSFSYNVFALTSVFLLSAWATTNCTCVEENRTRLKSNKCDPKHVISSLKSKKRSRLKIYLEILKLFKFWKLQIRQVSECLQT